MSLDTLKTLVTTNGPGNGPVLLADNLEKVIVRHNLHAYAYHNLSSQLSPRFRDECAIHYQFQRILSALYFDELKCLHAVFTQAGEQAIVYKGGALIPELFPDLGSRTLSDIDIWVEPKRFESVCDLFLQSGYEDPEFPTWEAGEGKRVFRKKHEKFFTDFEVHQKNYSFENQSVFTAAEGATGILKPSREEHFLMLVIHAGYQHTFTELKWWIDIIFFLRANNETMNWPKLAELCAQHQMTRLMTNVLAMSEATSPELRYPKSLFQSTRLKSFDAEFLLNPSQGSYRYYFLKHALKENLGRTLLYDALWLKSRLLPKRPVNSKADT